MKYENYTHFIRAIFENNNLTPFGYYLTRGNNILTSFGYYFKHPWEGRPNNTWYTDQAVRLIYITPRASLICSYSTRRSRVD